MTKSRDREDDYAFARQTYYQLISASLKVLPALTELAEEAEHPKGYEVFAQFVKNIADTNDKFVNLQRKQQVMDKEAGIIESDVEKPNAALTFEATSAEILALIEEKEVNDNNTAKARQEGELHPDDLGGTESS